MAKVRTQIQTLAGRKPGDVLRLSAAAQPQATEVAPTSNMRLLDYRDTLALSSTAQSAGATARVQPLGPRALAVAQQVAAPATSPVPVQPAPTATPTPAPAANVAPAAPAYTPSTAEAQVATPIAQATDEDAAFKAAEKLLLEELEKHHAQPSDDKDPDKQTPAKDDKPSADKPDAGDAQKLKDLAPQELARLGREDKKGFFDALRPAAEEAERKYGVPAAITLAQAALETGWAQHIIPGYNIFGIKGHGPAGTTSQGTWEVYSGKKVTITANFAKYNNFYEAVLLHGKLFHNGYYDKAIDQYAKDHDAFAFAKNITGVYATDPSYGSKLSSIIRQYKLV